MFCGGFFVFFKHMFYVFFLYFQSNAYIALNPYSY